MPLKNYLFCSTSNTYLSRIRIRSDPVWLGYPDPDLNFLNSIRRSGSSKNWPDPQHWLHPTSMIADVSSGPAAPAPDPCTVCSELYEPVCDWEGTTHPHQCSALCRNKAIKCHLECPCPKPGKGRREKRLLFATPWLQTLAKSIWSFLKRLKTPKFCKETVVKITIFCLVSAKVKRGEGERGRSQISWFNETIHT